MKFKFKDNCRTFGICIIALGTGIMIARVMPIGLLVFVTGVSLICLGCNCMKR